MNNYRQGEIVFLQLKKPRKAITKYGFGDLGSDIIREGEKTGHMHQVINGKLYNKGDKMILEAYDNCVIVHPEHKALPVAKGVYEIVIQREYDEHKDSRKVKD